MSCDSFQFQEDSQAEYDLDPSDPYGLDGPPGPDFEGIEGVACEHLPPRVEQHPKLELDLRASPSPANFGDTITYTYAVRNTGDAELTGVVVLDDEIGSVACPEPILAVGAEMRCTATSNMAPRRVTLEDVASGRVTNEVTADSDQTEAVTDQVKVTISRHPKLEVTKTCPAQRETGETLDLTATVTNPGDVSLAIVMASDDRGTPDLASDDVRLTLRGGDGNGNGRLDPGETWTFVGSYTVGDSPHAGSARVTVVGFGPWLIVEGASAACTTQIQWGDEGCSAAYWNAHAIQWDGMGANDATTTIRGDMYFNATFGVNVHQSGLGDDVTLLEATGLSHGASEELASYAAAALASADAGIAYRYRVGEVMKLYRDAVGADVGPETVESVLAKPSARESLSCPADLVIRHLSGSGSDQRDEIGTSRSNSNGTGTSVPSVVDGARADRDLDGRDLMVLMGVLQVFGLGGLGYLRQRAKKLRRAARWR
jgi:hypothetical protein